MAPPLVDRLRGALAGIPRPRLRLPERALPSVRTLIVGLALAAAAVGAYALARQTTAFAVDRVEVAGASPRLERRVRASLAPLAGTSLLAVSAEKVERRLRGIPAVVDAKADRAFPHTLRVAVRHERAAALLRQGSRGWLVSARGRVLRPVKPRRSLRLPRVWVAAGSALYVGELVEPAAGGDALAALAALRAAPAPLRRSLANVHASADALVLELRSGLRIALGDTEGLPLKFAVLRLVLPKAADAKYVDVSVPDRPVIGSQES